ncbi:hypothetical protein OG369_41065 [Streptomyces sp. NBC_01221]|uniref:hypothetical protein n=1 Tax=Streptomyces sp. NBC_01221 TaxID=2903782 RepID=UPI002250D18B|nr:hypothetical protein [Streptomyces sp. NBC_01221]MCX4792205.1 hypothetical protein [Streptomyces sp. NBC_01221]
MVVALNCHPTSDSAATTPFYGAVAIQKHTLIEGGRKGDGVFEIIRRHGFRYFPSLRQLGISRSCDRAAQS